MSEAPAPGQVEQITAFAREQLTTLARENYADHPAALPLLIAHVYGQTEGEKTRAAYALNALDPLVSIRDVIARARRTHLRAVPPRSGDHYIDPDHPDAEREPTPPRIIGFEAADVFLARLETQGEPEWLVRDLIPDDGIAVWHGRPRSMKSLAALELNLAGASGAAPFGSERFEISDRRSGSFLYLTEEDGERLIASRLRLMLAGRNLSAAPSRLRILARPGWTLERPDDQAAVLAAIRDVSPPPTMLTIDPARGSMPALDKGPADASGAVRFLRQLLRETPVRAVLMVHHDVKPQREGKDDRARAERASGGAVFSIADAPVNFERVTDRACFAVPCAYKVGADPKPFRIEFESGSPAGEPFREFLRAHAVTTDERTQAGVRVEAEIVRVLDEADDWMPSAAILEAVQGRRQEKLAALKRLGESGRATMREAGRAREWRRGLVV